MAEKIILRDYLKAPKRRISPAIEWVARFDMEVKILNRNIRLNCLQKVPLRHGIQPDWKIEAFS